MKSLTPIILLLVTAKDALTEATNEADNFGHASNLAGAIGLIAGAIRQVEQVHDDGADKPIGPIIGEWRKHECDGHVYRLREVQAFRPQRGNAAGQIEIDCQPRILSLECSGDWQTMGMGSDEQYLVDEDDVVEVEESAFTDFAHLCSFAEEVGKILNCEPSLIVRAI
ncbi:MAG: hypothetical protein E4H01_06150 [Lysobacterales bacterium]|nr:MAG: hypothetical protein E4H01_06150 [Xanthomonadales bacterium]